jgi:hypothetical protein
MPTPPFRTASSILLLVSLLTPTAWGQSLAELLDAAPADAELVVLLPDPDRLDQQLAELSADTGLDRYAPALDNALATFKRQVGLREGINDQGPMLLAVSGLAASLQAEFDDTPEQPEPTVLALTSVRDYEGFVRQLGGDPAADAAAITLAGGQDGFARKVNDFALLGDTQENVAGYAPGGRGQAMLDALGDLAVGPADDAVVLIYADVAAMASALDTGLIQMREELQQQMGVAAEQMPAGTMDIAQGTIDVYTAALRELVAGTDRVMLSGGLDDAGLTLHAGLSLKNGSKLAGYFPAPAAGGTSPGALLAGLPDEPFIYAAAIDGGGFAWAQMMDDLTGMVEAGVGGNAGVVAMYLESLEMMKDADAMASVFFAPQPAAMMTGGFFTTLTVYQVEDAERFVAAQRSYIEKLGDLKVPMPALQPGQPAGEMTFNARYTDKALVIDGVEVDEFRVNTVLPPEMMQQFGPMAALMGNSGQNGYIAAKGDRVLITTVTDQQLITRGLRALDAEAGFGSGGVVQQMREQRLAEGAWLESYLSLGGVAQTVNPFLPMLLPGGQPLDVPDDLAPLALGANSDGDGLAVRLVVPASLLRFGVDTYEQLVPADEAATPRDGARRAPRRAY